MSAQRCEQCARYWSFTGNPDLFKVISKFCPVCIAAKPPLSLPALGNSPMLARAIGKPA